MRNGDAGAAREAHEMLDQPTATVDALSRTEDQVPAEDPCEELPIAA
jgi:hypothetical protein